MNWLRVLVFAAILFVSMKLVDGVLLLLAPTLGDAAGLLRFVLLWGVGIGVFFALGRQQEVGPVAHASAVAGIYLVAAIGFDLLVTGHAAISPVVLGAVALMIAAGLGLARLTRPTASEPSAD